jgi:hypothetical protein
MEEPTVTVTDIAALPLDDPDLDQWLEQYVIDYVACGRLLAAVRIGAPVACSCRGSDLILWLPLAHDRYAVIGHVHQGRVYYAIPHDAIIPR